MILPLKTLNTYIVSLAKSLDTRGWGLPVSPIAEQESTGKVRFTITGTFPGQALGDADIILEETWSPGPGGFARAQYAYDLIDGPNNRRRAFHLHDGLLSARLGVVAHEHCKETLGEPECDHYLGREMPNGYLALDLLIAAWVEPDRLGCDQLRCLG